jgi:hypothetical protein
MLCLKACSVGAVSGGKKQIHLICPESALNVAHVWTYVLRNLISGLFQNNKKKILAIFK